MKKAAAILTRIMAAAVVAVILGFAADRRNGAACTKVEVSIESSGDMRFLTEDDVLAMVRDRGDALTGRPLASVDVVGLEKMLANNPFVSAARVFATVGGCVRMDIQQRRPVARVIGNFGKSYYLDSEGVIMPLSDHYTARVLVVNGKVNLPFHSGYSILRSGQDHPDRLLLLDIYRLASFIDGDAFWKAQIMQVFVDERGEFILTPRIGDHSIVLGDAQNLDEKFGKLLTFYREGLNATGWNRYKTINLKYHQQIVCTKR